MARSRDFTTSLRTGWVFIRDIGFAACLTALQVYGEVHTGDFIGSSTLDPTNPYSASKGAAEMFVKAYMKSHKLPAVIIRLNNVMGPHQVRPSRCDSATDQSADHNPVPRECVLAL